MKNFKKTIALVCALAMVMSCLFTVNVFAAPTDELHIDVVADTDTIRPGETVTVSLVPDRDYTIGLMSGITWDVNDNFTYEGIDIINPSLVFNVNNTSNALVFAFNGPVDVTAGEAFAKIRITANEGLANGQYTITLRDCAIADTGFYEIQSTSEDIVVNVSDAVAPPTAEPTADPTAAPTAEPTAEPTAPATAEPTTEPGEPTTEPTEPTAEPGEPTSEPVATATAAPTAAPTTAPTYAITVEAENGTVEYTPAAPEAGDTVTLTIVPDFGYQYVDGSLAVTAGEEAVTVTDNTFVMPASDVTIVAEFRQMEAADVITEATELSNGVTADINAMIDALTPEEGESLINEAQQANIDAANEAKTALDNAVAAYGTEATEENLQAVIDAGQALVEASKNVVPYTVSWTIPQNTDSVTVTVNGAEIASGDSIYPASVVEVDVDAATGYYVRNLSYNGTGFSGSFDMPAEDVTITWTTVRPSGGGSGAGGWGGTGSGTTPTATPSATAGADVTPAPTEEQVFTDVPSSYWGYEYIMDLYDAGIVNGYEDGTFLPDNTVTRAEFTKMAVELFGLTNTATTSAFLDCTASDWYTPYVIAASEAGIVTGVSDEWFDANNTITREDICTIVGRYLNLSSNSASSFTDSADIADYAAGYVAGMVEAGYLTGYEDGTFLPKNNATRAEAAAILARVMNADEAEATASPEATADAEATAAPETTASPEATADAEATASPEATATADAE